MEELNKTSDPIQVIHAAKEELELAYYQINEALNFLDEPLKQVLNDV